MLPAGFEPIIPASGAADPHLRPLGPAPLSNTLPNLRYGFSVFTTACSFIGTDVVEENVGRS